MCTAVVGGSSQRMATRVNTASAQRTAIPMSNQRTNERSEPFQGSALADAFGFSVTLPDNRSGWISIAPISCQSETDHYPTSVAVTHRKVPTLLQRAPRCPLLKSIHAAQGVLGNVLDFGPPCGLGFAVLVGAPRHHSHRFRKLVDRLPLRLVLMLALPCAACRKSCRNC